MNIIDERNIRTIKRKIKKKEYDEMITLAVPESGQTVRLLDEGMVVDSAGNPWFYIMKGTLAKYMDALPDDYEGSINLGHMQFATFPLILGKWTKKDLSLVDIGDGRMGLDVNLRLDDESFLVKELKRMPYDLGVSAEFTYHRNDRLTEEYNLEILDEIFIGDFAIVGEAGNVNSSNITLKGDTTVDFEKLLAKLQGKETDSISELNDLMDKALSAEEVVEEVTEEAAEETAEETAEEVTEETTEEVTEETTEEVTEEATEEESEEPEGDNALAGILSIMNDLRVENERLTAENSRLQAQLDASKKAEKDFIEKFKNLSVSIREEKKPEKPAEKHHQFGMTNGIGEL